MKRILSLLAIIAVVTTATARAETLRGTGAVTDGANLVVAGVKVQLDGISVPATGDICQLKGKHLDCGRLARAGLMDITAGAEVVCENISASTYRCTAGRYDISYGQIHAGWAVALNTAPEHYHRKMDNARERQRGLWAARSLDNSQIYALTLKH